jgi:cytochrome c oxidase subunit 1
MKSFFSKPHNWFLIAMPVFYLIGSIYAGNTAIDIQLHDTMFVIASNHIYLIPYLVFFIWSCLHVTIRAISNFQPNRTIAFIHFVLTFTMPFLLSVPLIYMSSQPRRYYPYSTFGTLNNFDALTATMAIVFVFFLFTQLLFFLYLLYLLGKSFLKAR